MFTRTIPDDYDLEFDICMKCGRRLEDRRYSTLMKHQQISHPVKKEKLIIELFYKHPIIFMVGAILLIGITLMSIPQYSVYPVMDYLLGVKNPVTLTDKQWATCDNETMKIKKQIYKDNGLTVNDIPVMNNLINNCNLNFYSDGHAVPITKEMRLDK